jgi:hypothetical protein
MIMAPSLEYTRKSSCSRRIERNNGHVVVGPFLATDVVGLSLVYQTWETSIRVQVCWLLCAPRAHLCRRNPRYKQANLSFPLFISWCRQTTWWNVYMRYASSFFIGSIVAGAKSGIKFADFTLYWLLVCQESSSFDCNFLALNLRQISDPWSHIYFWDVFLHLTLLSFFANVHLTLYHSWFTIGPWSCILLVYHDPQFAVYHAIILEECWRVHMVAMWYSGPPVIPFAFL